jgi:hypothetical protein
VFYDLGQNSPGRSTSPRWFHWRAPAALFRNLLSARLIRERAERSFPCRSGSLILADLGFFSFPWFDYLTDAGQTRSRAYRKLARVLPRDILQETMRVAQGGVA